MSDKLSITSKIQSKERELPALRYTSPYVAAFQALMGVNVENGFTSVGTRMCQTLWAKVGTGAAKLMGNRGTSGATGRWQAWLGTRASDLSDSERESGLQSLLIARAMPTERQFMACYMFSGLSVSELNSACVKAFGDKEGTAFASVVRSVAKFVSVSTSIVQADIKKKSGATQNLTSGASDAIAATREAQAAVMLDILLPKSGAKVEVG